MTTQHDIDDTPLRQMFHGLDRRYRPEDVADLVLRELRDALPHRDRQVINKVARRALVRTGSFSSMTQDFHRPVGMAAQMAVARRLFAGVAAPAAVGFDDDPDAVLEYLSRAERLIGKSVGANSFLKDRLNRVHREIEGVDWSKRQYNKRFRLATRMEAKCDRLRRLIQARGLTLVSKSRLTSRLSWEEFSADRDAACFVAYYAARCSLRSEFTIDVQQRPYDEVADLLLRRCRQSGWTNWWAIAHAFPEKAVLARLDGERKGTLLARWFAVLEQLSAYLRDLWQANRFDRRTMIVRRGNDSSTWNVMAGAWNKARESWFALLDAMEMRDVTDAMCPGKVLRLMAADVAAWHRMAGGRPSDDTPVWAELPLPWEVLSGAATCTRADVEACCARHGVDPVKSGWTAARSGPRVATFRPTPELVHGVTVGQPGLALTLRKLGFFSGKA
jgi:hypothetical protein